MDNFSFLCKISGDPVLSDSFSGCVVHLFLLKDGNVIEHMYGNYDGYGRVFKNVKDKEDEHTTPFSAFKWNTPWNIVVDLMRSKDKKNGIAAILAPHWKKGDPLPVERSEDDSDQGLELPEKGRKMSPACKKWVEKPYHEITREVGMTLTEFAQNLVSFTAENPEYANVPVLTADEKDENFYPIMHSPSFLEGENNFVGICIN